MKKPTFKENETHFPITMQQFETLTNEILKEINKVSDPHFVDGDYVGQILMSALHAYDHKIAYVKKTELFASCLNRISCHVTYHAVQAIQARIKAKNEPLEPDETLEFQGTQATQTSTPDTQSELEQKTH